MAITLNTIRPGKGAKRTKLRVGRGLGSRGTTAGRGQKGQKSRSGVGGLKRLGLRSLMLATPKLRGFQSQHDKAQAVNLSAISKKYIAGETVTPRTLAKKGLVTDPKGEVKILGNSPLSVAFTVKGCSVSVQAKEQIEKAGGKVA